MVSHGKVVCPLWSIYLLNLSKLLYLLNVATTFLILKENDFGKGKGQQTGDDTYSWDLNNSLGWNKSQGWNFTQIQISI